MTFGETDVLQTTCICAALAGILQDSFSGSELAPGSFAPNPDVAGSAFVLVRYKGALTPW